MKRLFTLIFSICLFVNLPAVASAIMLGLSTEDMTMEAQIVIIGTAQQVEPKWTVNQGAIYTEVQVNVEEVIKGKLDTDTVVVTYLGGEIGDLGFRVSDTPTIEKGENILLFLKPDTNNQNVRSTTIKNTFQIVGSAQGKYSIDNRKMASKRGFDLIAEDDSKVDRDIPLNELIEKIKATDGGTQ
ncbi:MAG: hypothetical protein L3V56_13105 [Candidatus Magnetoovum sp. WYHC-5]|nr:hypothetical protein [Candidatus Magnetoovum sp. WYHC-5]